MGSFWQSLYVFTDKIWLTNNIIQKHSSLKYQCEYTGCTVFALYQSAVIIFNHFNRFKWAFQMSIACIGCQYLLGRFLYSLFKCIFVRLCVRALCLYEICTCVGNANEKRLLYWVNIAVLYNNMSGCPLTHTTIPHYRIAGEEAIIKCV